METFEKRKIENLASISSSGPDKSPKGSIDEPIIPLLNTINSHPFYFTTSSCSGRISVLSHPTTTATTTTKKKARGGKWIFITHHKADPDSLLNLLFPSTAQNSPTSTTEQPSDLVLRFEPLIVAIECKDVHSAMRLVSLAISCGFRESGVTSVSNKRVIIVVRCSIRLEVPLGGGGDGVLVSPEYVRYLVGIANEKLEANWRRTESFLSVLESSGFRGAEVAENGGGAFVNGEAGDEESEAMDYGDQLNILSDGKVHGKNHVGVLLLECNQAWKLDLGHLWTKIHHSIEISTKWDYNFCNSCQLIEQGLLLLVSWCFSFLQSDLNERKMKKDKLIPSILK